jgi:hypothetical protein
MLDMEKQWITYGMHKMLYSQSPPRSLWWCELLRDPERLKEYREDPRTLKDIERVLDIYVRQVARGRAVDKKQLKKDLRKWIQELVEPLVISRCWRGKGYLRYWMLPYYAKVHGLQPYTFMKRFREMEKIAKRLFPKRVPSRREPEPVSEELKCKIRDRYLRLKWDIHGNRKSYDNEDAYQRFRHRLAMKRLMKKFSTIPPFRLGQICREVRKAKRFPRLRLIYTLSDLFLRY